MKASFLSRKGEILINLPIFNDTYAWVKTLQEESDDNPTAVYVVRHQKLGNTRILKSIRKKNSNSHDYLTEAEILVNLKHPGIPTLYDYGEDESYICLIEELVSGMSLKAYLLRHKISLKDIITILDKTSDILIYLHGRKPPILYQDLKPEHIILEGDDIRLIDYGIARTIENSNQNIQIFGTPLYAAPEVKLGESVDERSDIYSLGVLFKEMLKSTDEKIPFFFENLINQATAEDKDSRLSSVNEFKKMLASFNKYAWETKEVKKHFSKRKNEVGSLQRKIAIIGSEHGIGTTHIAISLTCFLNSIGENAIYENRSGADVTSHLFQNESHFKSRDNIIYHGNFKGFREFGKSIPASTIEAGAKIIDCGTDVKNASDSEFIVFVFSSCPWKDMTIDLDAYISENSYLLLNPENRAVGIRLSKYFKKKVYGFPNADDAFVLTKRKLEIFKRILKEV